MSICSKEIFDYLSNKLLIAIVPLIEKYARECQWKEELQLYCSLKTCVYKNSLIWPIKYSCFNWYDTNIDMYQENEKGVMFDDLRSENKPRQVSIWIRGGNIHYYPSPDEENVWVSLKY